MGGDPNKHKSSFVNCISYNSKSLQTCSFDYFDAIPSLPGLFIHYQYLLATFLIFQLGAQHWTLMVHIWVTPWTRYDAVEDVFVLPAANADYLRDPYSANLLFTSMGASITLFALFVLLSTSAQRRSTIFYIHLISFIMLLSTCAIIMTSSKKIEHMFDKEDITDETVDQDIKFLSISFVMEKITCVIADLALFFRLWHYHPSVLYSTKRKWFRLGPLVFLTPPRVVLGFVYARYYGLHQRALASKINLAEFLVQMAYCLYATVLLLAMSGKFYFKTTRREDRRLMKELRMLIESIVCTFLVPLVFQIICICILLIYEDPWSHNFRLFNSCNTFTTVQSALLSTTWSSIRGFTDDEDRSAPALSLVKSFFYGDYREAQVLASKEDLANSGDLIGLDSILRE